MKYIAEAYKRPIELTQSQFEHEKKIKRYDPTEYTFQEYNPYNFPKHEHLNVPGVTIVRENKKISAAAADQMNLFQVENTNI